MDKQKCAIIGCGAVGATIAFALTQKSLFSELVLIDANKARAEGEAMDLSHGLPFAHPMKVYAGDYCDISDCFLIIITAGTAQRPNETRLDMVHKNVEIFKNIIPNITKYNNDAIILVVSNPVDILTYCTIKLSGFPSNRVLGSGTVLDTARLKYLLGQRLCVDSRSVHAFIIGEHGDSEIAAWSSANVSGIPLHDFCEMRGHHDHEGATSEIAEKVKNSAYEIIQRKGATYYGIAMSVKRICEAIIRDERSILQISTMMDGEYGIKDVVLSMPSIVGAEGFISKVPISLSEDEIKALHKSAETLKSVLEEALE